MAERHGHHQWRAARRQRSWWPGVAVARTGSLPKAAGIGFALSMGLFVIGAIPDNGPWQGIASALMVAFTVWIAAAAKRHGAPAPAAGR
jgi:hypothetical protein